MYKTGVVCVHIIYICLRAFIISENIPGWSAYFSLCACERRRIKNAMKKEYVAESGQFIAHYSHPRRYFSIVDVVVLSRAEKSAKGGGHIFCSADPVTICKLHGIHITFLTFGGGREGRMEDDH